MECQYESTPEKYLNYKLMPNYRLLGKLIGKDMGAFKQFLDALTDEQVSGIIQKSMVIIPYDNTQSNNLSNSLLIKDSKDRWSVCSTQSNIDGGKVPSHPHTAIDISFLTIESNLKVESQSWQISYDGEFILILDPTVTADLVEVYYMKYFSRRVQEYNAALIN